MLIIWTFGFLLHCYDSLVPCLLTLLGLGFLLTACHIFSAIRIRLKKFGAETVAPWLVWVYREMAMTKQNNKQKEKLPGPPVFGQRRCYLQPCLWSIFLTLLARIHTLCHFGVHTSCHMVTMCPEQVNRLEDYYIIRVEKSNNTVLPYSTSKSDEGKHRGRELITVLFFRLTVTKAAILKFLLCSSCYE